MSISNRDTQRRTWMIPRPKRYLDPYLYSRLCSEIEKTLAESWSGNIENQKSFTKNLENQNLKRKGEQYDKNSGGPRTYFNQLECLGLIFKNKKNYYLTISGEAIASGIEPKKILQYNLLRLQYPSPYSRSSNCNIHPEIKIKPFLFILELLLDEKVKTLNDYELILITVFGKNFKSKKVCIEKILQLRDYEDPKEGLKEILKPHKKKLQTSRTKENSLEKIINNLKDNANTLGNYLQGVDLVKVNSSIKPKTIEFNDEYLKVYDDANLNKNKFINSNSNEQFQRVYGRYLNKKDTRTLEKIKKIKGKILDKDHQIKLKFFELESMFIDNSYVPESFYDNLYESYSIKKEEANKVINPIIKNHFDDNLKNFLEISKSGKKYHVQFEKEISKIFSNYWGFYSHHTGHIKRESNMGGGYSDIFVVPVDKKSCALIDAKAIKNYSLPHDDRLNMINNYVPNYRELVEKFDYIDLSLNFITYVSTSINHKSKIHEWCSIVSKECENIPVSAVSADDFAKLARRYKGKVNQTKVINTLAKTGVVQLKN